MAIRIHQQFIRYDIEAKFIKDLLIREYSSIQMPESCLEMYAMHYLIFQIRTTIAILGRALLLSDFLCNGFLTVLELFLMVQHLPKKLSSHHYSTSGSLNCWHKAGRDHGFMLEMPKSGPTICMSQQKPRFLILGGICPVFKCSGSVNLCSLYHCGRSPLTSLINKTFPVCLSEFFS